MCAREREKERNYAYDAQDLEGNSMDSIFCSVDQAIEDLPEYLKQPLAFIDESCSSLTEL